VEIGRAISSSWSMFLYLAFSVLFSYLHQIQVLDKISSLIFFTLVSIGLYFSMLNQKSYQLNDGGFNDRLFGSEKADPS
jgi:hypothetical protein